MKQYAILYIKTIKILGIDEINDSDRRKTTIKSETIVRVRVCVCGYFV